MTGAGETPAAATVKVGVMAADSREKFIVLDVVGTVFFFLE